MDKAIGLEIHHSIADLQRKVAQDRNGEEFHSQIGVLEALQQRPEMGEFCDEHQRVRRQHDTIQSYNVLVVDRMHDCRFLEKLHRIALHSLTAKTFYRHLNSLVAIRPDALLHDAELTHTQLLIDAYRVERNDVFVVGNLAGRRRWRL